MSGALAMRMAFSFTPPRQPSPGERSEELLKELEELRRTLRGGKGELADRLGPLSLSIASLVEQFPLEDPLGLGTRLLGALADLCAAVAQSKRCSDCGELKRQRARVTSAVAEAGYLVGLSQELGYGRPEQAISTIGRIEAMEGALKPR